MYFIIPKNIYIYIGDAQFVDSKELSDYEFKNSIPITLKEFRN